ncbi:MAG: hypothetical protein PF568_00215 [Deltaproteobacteria bacterium]|nr:hypothetical protein [Deltaproteobacteria bacterium]
MTRGRARPAAKEDTTSLRFVGCGQALQGHALRIVDDNDQEVA